MFDIGNEKIIEQAKLKAILKDYQRNGQSWDKKTKNIIIKSMLAYIGSTDSELRDELIYSSFCNLILDNHLEHELIVELLMYSLSDELLFKGIDEKETDSVFTRSFTTLLIAVILYKDNQADFLNQNLVIKVKDKLIDYIHLEKDLRGFVPGKGWAHSIAHASDAFGQLVKSKKIKPELFIEIIRALWKKVFVYDYVYIHDEEERILIPLIDMLNDGVILHEIEKLLQNIPLDLQGYKHQVEEEAYWVLIANCKSFLKSFYIQLIDYPNLKTIQKKIYQVLSNI